jgi:AcrR family transcriptional regulator
MTRNDILVAAAAIFSQKGFHAASMQDIAEAVSLQKASLYYHFPSKQDILEALVELALETINARLEAVLARDLPPEERLRQAMVCYMQALGEHQDLVQVLLLEYRSLDDEQRSRHLPKRDWYEHLWRDLVLEGRKAGVFTCENASLAGRALLGVMNWTVTWYRKDGPLSIEQIADQYIKLFLQGLLVRSTDPSPQRPEPSAVPLPRGEGDL